MSTKRNRTVEVIASGVRFTPRQVARFRFEIFRTVEGNLAKVSEVLSGELKWNSSQTKLFIGLLGKVVPDITESFHMHLRRESGMDGIDLRAASRSDLEQALTEAMKEETSKTGGATGAAAIPETAQAAEISAELTSALSEPPPETKGRDWKAINSRPERKMKIAESRKCQRAKENARRKAQQKAIRSKGPVYDLITREADDANRHKMQREVAKERRRGAERLMRKALRLVTPRRRV